MGKVKLECVFFRLNGIRFENTEMLMKLCDQANLRGYILAVLAQTTTTVISRTVELDFVVA